MIFKVYVCLSWKSKGQMNGPAAALKMAKAQVFNGAWVFLFSPCLWLSHSV